LFRYIVCNNLFLQYFMERRLRLIRRAMLEDARALATLAERTFRSTFGSFNTVEDTDIHCRSTYGETIQAQEISSAATVTLLTEEEGELIAFAQLRWMPPPACVPARDAGEIQRFYVRDDRHGMGVAQALMEACIGEFERRKCAAVWLGVWENNPKAMAFYRKAGFVEVGEHLFALGDDLQRDIVMCKSLVVGGVE